MATQNFRVKNGLEVGIGATILVSDSGGNIGIGSTQPTSKLDVNGSVTATSFIGNVATATSLSTARNFSVSGDASTASAVSFDGTADVDLAITIAAGVVTTGNIANGTILNEDISSSAAIDTSKLSANTISGVTLGGNLNTLTRGTYLTGNNYNGSTATTWAVDATSANTASKVVVRDGSGNFSANTITLAGQLNGPENFIIDPATVGDNTGSVRIKGDLYVDGTNFIVDSQTITLADHVVGIASTATTDALTDGAGIQIGPDNTFLYEYNGGTNPSLKSSENLNVASGKHYQIGETEVLNATTLGSGVTNSSLTSLGTIATGVWQGTAIDDTYIGTINNANKVSLTALNIDGGTETTTLADADLFIVDDGGGGTNRRITASNAKTYFSTGVDAATLDGIDSTQFLRSDATDTFSGTYLTFSDSSFLRLGDSGDLRLFHNGTNSFIDQTGVGQLYIRNNVDDKDIVIQTDDGSGSLATYFLADGSTGEVILSHYGTQKLATKSNGIDVTGHTETDTLKVSGISTLGTVKISSGIVTASSGIVTYYGDGSNLTGISAGFTPDADENLIAGTGAGGSYDPATGTSCYNIFMGCNAGNNINGGYNNNFFGLCAGYNNSTGSQNNFFGLQVGRCNTTGSDNNFLGRLVGDKNSTGGCNNFFGFCAGYENTTGDYNNFIGFCAGFGNTIGHCNNMIGMRAGQCANVLANSNNFIGASAGRCASGSGSCNNFIGRYTGYKNTTGNANNFIGLCAGFGNTTGNCNNFFGYNAGKCNTTGNNNNFFGYEAGRNNITGSFNNYFGCNTGVANTTGSCNNFFGRGAGCDQTTGNNNIAIGCNVQLPNTTGSNQLAIGVGANHWIDGDIFYSVTLAGIVTATAAGNVCATAYYGDGSNLTGTGFTQDADGNLIAGNGAGGSYDPATGTSCYNIFMGCNAGNSINGGYNNNFFGNRAGLSNESGACNNFFGFGAGCNNTTGYLNNFFGPFAGMNNTTGNANTFIGGGAGLGNTTGSYNIMIGDDAGRFGDGTGDYNTFIGACAGGSASGSGGYNNFFGCKAGCSNETGNNNNFIGRGAGKDNTTGNNNNFIGIFAGYCNTSGSYNNFFGCKAGCNNTTGSNNIFFGCNTGVANTTASDNIMIGSGAGRCAILCGTGGDGEDNVFIGKYAGKCVSGCGKSNNFLGLCAGYCNTNGEYNNFFGNRAGYNNTTGCNNNFFGKSAGCSNTTGNCNVFLSYNAGQNNTTGDYNVFIGGLTGFSNTTGNGNNFIGRCAGYSNTGNCNNFFGYEAGRNNTTGSFNNFFGCGAGACNITGQYNNFFGNRAGLSNTTGNCNSFFGRGAGCDQTTGDNNIAIGCNVQLLNTTGSDQLAIGVGANHWIDGDSSYNITLAGIVTATATGNVCATAYYGDGSNLTNISTGFTPDADENLIAGNGAGGSYDPATGTSCYNIFMGCNAGDSINGGDRNIFLGCHAGRGITSGSDNVVIGVSRCGGSGSNNVALGCCVMRCAAGDNNILIGQCAGTNTNASENIFIGRCAGQDVALARQLGNNSILIGCNVIGGNPAVGSQFAIGNGTNHWISGDSSYNIGFGTDVPSGAADPNNTKIVNAGIVTANFYYGDGSNLTGISAGGGDIVPTENTTNQAQFIPFFVGTAQTSIAGISSATLVFNPSTNRLGVGTDSPQATLHVVDEFLVSTAGAASTQRISQKAYTTDNGTLSWEGSVGQLFSITNNLTSGSIFSVNDVSGIPSIDVDADGTIQLAPFGVSEFVGVGLTNPQAKLHVDGVSIFQDDVNIGVGGTTAFFDVSTGNIGIGSTQPTAKLDVDGGVNVTGVVTATDFNSTSDAKLKTNVQVIENPLEKVLQINGVSFNWIKDNNPSIGVIADNIQEVLPELVSNSDPKTVNYNGLIGLLIEVVKEQQSQIDDLNNRLSKLE